MANENLEETAEEKIEITLSLIHKNGTRWSVKKISKDGRGGPHYGFIELKEQLPAIQGPVELVKPIVVEHYNKLKKLVDGHNKKYDK